MGDKPGAIKAWRRTRHHFAGKQTFALILDIATFSMQGRGYLTIIVPLSRFNDSIPNSAPPSGGHVRRHRVRHRGILYWLKMKSLACRRTPAVYIWERRHRIESGLDD